MHGKDGASLSRITESLARVGLHLGAVPKDLQDLETRVVAAAGTAELSRLSRSASLSRLPAEEPETHEVTINGQTHRVTRGVYEASQEMTERMRKRFPQAK